MDRKDGNYHVRRLRNREKDVPFMDLHQWTENAVKGRSSRRFRASTGQSEGTDGTTYAEQEFYRSVGIDELKASIFSLVPSRHIEFASRGQAVVFEKAMAKPTVRVVGLLARRQANHTAFEKGFAALGCKPGTQK